MNERIKYSHFEALPQLVADRFITARPHPTLPLNIYNYTVKAQMTPVAEWTEPMKDCRGLILDHEGYIVGRPFRKFWNMSQMLDQVPVSEPFTVWEKLDGCFSDRTKVNLWGGGTLPIGTIVKRKLKPTLAGMDESGNVVPCEIVDWFDNGQKDRWLLLTLGCEVSNRSGCRTGNHMPVTPNHHIHLNGSFRPACEAKEGDSIVTFEESPDERAIHVMRGCLLGDGSLSPLHGAFRFSEGHTMAQWGLTDHITELLGDCAVVPQFITSGYGSKMKQSVSRAYKSLKFLRDEWYSGGIKSVPVDISWMDDFSVALWYAGDGNLAHSDKQEDRACFSTNGFTLHDVNRLASKLESLYGVKCSIQDSKGFSIRINAGRDKSIEKFWNAISPYVPAVVRYKLPARFREQLTAPIKPGRNIVRPANSIVLGVKDLSIDSFYLHNSRRGYDLKTTTGNYFCKGALVHNSLGIVCSYAGERVVATRGSFESEQAVWFKRWLDQKHPHFTPYGDTWLFEIIFPANRIVVDYGDRKEGVLLAVMSPDGVELTDIFNGQIRFHSAREFDGIKDFSIINSDPHFAGEEGFVVKWANGFMAKVKADEYCRLHRLITSCSTRTIWELLRSGAGIQELVDRVPAEFKAWVENTAAELRFQAESFRDNADTLFGGRPGCETRKDFAMWATKQDHPQLLFALLDGKDISDMCWKLVEPAWSTPFRKESEDV